MLLILFAIVSLLLALPFVQTKLGNTATSYLQEEFDVAIEVGKIDLSFLGDVKFKNILISDHHKDTLIYVENLKSSIYSFRKVVSGKLEFGEISLDYFILNIKTYKNEEENGLTIFVDKFDENSGEVIQDEKPSNFRLNSDRIFLNEGYVGFINENDEEVKPLFFKSIKGTASDLSIKGPDVNVKLLKLGFIENHNVEAKSLSTDFSYTKESMKFLNTILETETSKLDADVKFSYKRDEMSDFNNKVNLDGVIRPSEISLVDLKAFYDEIGTKDKLYLTANLSGQLNNLEIKDLDLTSDANAIIRGDLHLINSLNSENGFSLDADFKNLTSDFDHLKVLLPNMLGDKLPPSLKEFGRFKLRGKTYVTSNLISANVSIDTDLGATIADIELTDLQDINKASYKGDLKIIDFKLGKVLNEELMGEVSLEAKVDGGGFTFDKINTSIIGNISKYEYKDYKYEDITINGIVKNQHFNGEMEVNDDNIKLNFNGLADLSQEIYEFDFKATVDHCNLYALNIFKRDTISNLKGEIEIKLKGSSSDNLMGVVNFKNSLYTNQNDNFFFKDFTITSKFEDSIRTISINSSEIVEGEISGKFRTNELGKLFQNSIGSIYTNYKPFEVTPNQSLEFKLEIYNKIVEVFLPDVTLSANSIIQGEIDSDKSLFKLNIKSPQIIAYSTFIKSLNLQIDNKNPLFNTQLIVDKIQSDIYDVSDLHLVNKTLNDTLYFGTEFKGGIEETEQYSFSFYHTFNAENKSVLGIQKSSFTFKDNEWFINPNNDNSNNVIYDSKDKSFTFNPFLISSKNQQIDFSGTINDTISQDLTFNFKGVNLASITPQVDSLELEGVINGSFEYLNSNNQLKPTVNLTVSNFQVNDSDQGNLAISIEGKNSVREFDVDIHLDRENSTSFSALGNISFTSEAPTLDVLIDFNNFKLDALSPLGEDVFNKIRGYAYGNVRVTGLLKNPEMNGELYLDEAGLYFPYLNIDYDFVGTSVISLKDQYFSFDDVTIQDVVYKTKGDLKGTLSHDHFKTWDLDLSINTNNLLVLNTVEDEFSLYYGTAFFGGVATIKGPTDKLVIDVIGGTNEDTYFVMPLSDVKTAETSQLIRFINTDETLEKEEIRQAFISEKLKGLSINLNLDVTKDAVFEMVIDKSSGSNLKASGAGNLQIQLDTRDKFNMYGDFIVDNGIYNFKYGGIINKPFTVRRGGDISWSGDPLTAEMNIAAIHRVSANPKTLLENISSSRKIPVDLITRFTGELFNSEIEFDIEIPNSSSTVASELEFKINNDKTTQFISLLVTGSFYNEGDIGINSNAVLYGTGADMLTNAFDNIFNSPESKFKIKPVYTVGDKNTVDNIDINDQLALALDYQVNDRIIINGKVGMPIGADEKASVIGEVNVEFLMNEEGTFRSSVFNRQNEIQYTEEEEGYTQGVGLTYQINFDNGRELLEKLSLKRKKLKDSTNTIKKVDTIANQKLINFKNKNSVKDE